MSLRFTFASLIIKNQNYKNGVQNNKRTSATQDTYTFFIKFSKDSKSKSRLNITKKLETESYKSYSLLQKVIINS